MQRRVLVVFGILGALAGLVLLFVLLGMDPPRVNMPEITDRPVTIPAPPDDGQRAEKQSGTLKGRVLHGITKKPIPGARIIALAPFLEAATEDTPARWGDMVPEAEVLSGSDGTFKVEELPANYWNLWIEKRGYAWTTIPRAKFTEDHVIYLYPGATVFGKIAFSDGKPAPGVRIEYTPQGTHSEVFSRYRLKQYYTTTKADGTFQYDDLPIGKFTIEVYPENHLPAPWTTEGPLKSGEVRDLGTHILDEGFGMEVHVLWRGTNEPVPGIEVVVKPLGDPMPRTTTGQRRRTNEKGIAMFHGLGGQVIDNPKFLVTANVDGVGPVMPDIGGQIRQDSNVVIYLRKDGTILGKVVRPNGKPLERFHVELRPTTQITRQLRAMGENGAFKMYSVPEGKYILHVRYGNLIDKAIPVEAIPGQDVDVGTVTLQEGSEVYGTVRLEDGSEVKGVTRVNLARKEKNRAGHEIFRMVGRGYVRKDGTYSIKGIPPGRFFIQALPEQGAKEAAPAEEIAVVANTATEKNFVLYSQGMLKFKFMDMIDGAPRHVHAPGKVFLFREGSDEETLWTHQGMRLRTGRYTAYVEIKSDDGVAKRYKAATVLIQAEETTGPIEVRLYEIRNDDQAGQDDSDDGNR